PSRKCSIWFRRASAPAASPTRATRSVARCHLSWWSISATAAPKRRRSCSVIDLSSLRFALRSCASPKCSSASSRQTNAVTRRSARALGRAAGDERTVAGSELLAPVAAQDAAAEAGGVQRRERRVRRVELQLVGLL